MKNSAKKRFLIAVMLIACFFSGCGENMRLAQQEEKLSQMELKASIVYGNPEMEPIDESTFDDLKADAFTNNTNIMGETETSVLESWIGRYVYEEALGDPTPMVMVYDIFIYKEGHDYFANVEICGQTTYVNIKCRVYGDKEWISIVYEEPLLDNFNWWGEKEDVVLSFRSENENIYTYWGEVEPMILEDGISGKIFFKRESGVDIPVETEENTGM